MYLSISESVDFVWFDFDDVVEEADVVEGEGEVVVFGGWIQGVADDGAGVAVEG